MSSSAMPFRLVTDAAGDEVLDAARNEVLRKMGRNLLLLQQMEGMLKCLVANSTLSGYLKDWPKVHEERASLIAKHTMGQLVGKYVDTAWSAGDGAAAAASPPGEVVDTWGSFSFVVEGDAAGKESQAAVLAEIVGERNELIHHFLPRWDTASLESTRSADAWLDRQREKVLPGRENLQKRIGYLRESMQHMVELLNSADGKDPLAQTLARTNPLVLRLAAMSQQHGRADGYLSLSFAAQQLCEQVPDELQAMRLRDGYKTLKALMLTSGFFDFLDEPTPKGVRVLYRLNPAWRVEGDVPDRSG